ncbi:nuclear transport factor 2 family protein [bacterium]|nr:MAG: nuclear transport factor 2 family protein [bacterium]
METSQPRVRTAHREIGFAFVACLVLAALVPAGVAAQEPPATEEDLAAARALFEKNLQAIRDRDREAYLSCYLESEGLVRTGPGGIDLGYAGLAATAGEGWPDRIEADDMRLIPVRPGLVYGTYRYRVRYGGQEVAGLSERLFVRTPEGWKIAPSGSGSRQGISSAWRRRASPSPWVRTPATP